MRAIDIAILINYALCLVIVLNMIFVSKKKPERIIAWTILLFVPFLGLFIYLIIGAGLNGFSKRMIKKYELSSKDYNSRIKKQINTLENNEELKSYPSEYKDLILLNLNNSASIFSRNNNIEYFLEGKSVLEALKKDIENATSSIHLQFYIFANDKTGKSLIRLLTKKAQEGVEVRVLYDAIGSIHTHKTAFKKLKKVGGKISEFFPPFLNIRFLNFKANYRNHRKICVIDGKIAYTGGFNIRDDHMGEVKRLAPWRDTSIRIFGGAAHSFQNIFLSDWRFATKDATDPNQYNNEKYFPSIKLENTSNLVSMQVITSGPYNVSEQIKHCMIKMIMNAKKSIKLQTPYFIPDDSFIEALKLAMLSGVEVELMFPKKIDHWHVHYASLSHLNDLLKYGIKIYVYDGFIHSKVLLVDDAIITLGSCNVDIRSFSLNFEDNVVIYNEDSAKEYSNYFEKDKEKCIIYTEKTRKKKKFFVKILISFCRLFSAIL